jgi:hypothetical protein
MGHVVVGRIHFRREAGIDTQPRKFGNRLRKEHGFVTKKKMPQFSWLLIM